MITSALLYHVLHFFHITIDIRNVCVFLAPLFSSFTAIVTYHFTKELKVQQNKTWRKIVFGYKLSTKFTLYSYVILQKSKSVYP